MSDYLKTGIWREEYPFASNFLELEPNVRMHYVDEGPKVEPKSTILCVHGNPTWSFYYRSIVSAFRNTHRVVAVDHIGCGLSDKPQKYRYTLAQHTACVKVIPKLLKHTIAP